MNEDAGELDESQKTPETQKSLLQATSQDTPTNQIVRRGRKRNFEEAFRN